MVKLRSAGPDDWSYIDKTQKKPTVKAFLSPFDKDEYLHSIKDPYQQILIAMSPQEERVGYAQICGIGSKQRAVEIRKIGISQPKQGYGSAVLSLLIENAFRQLNAHRLWLDVFPDNSLARALYKNLGFVEEGTLRDSYYFDGHFRSVVIMSILEGEFKNPKN